MVTVAPASTSTELVTSAGGLERLTSSWEALRLRCPNATPFQSPAWTIPWWRTFGEGSLQVLAVWSGGRLVGLVPLYLRRAPESGRRGLRLLGTGNSDHLDALCEPGEERAVTDATAEHLAALRCRLDDAQFLQLPPSSALLGVTAGWRVERAEGEPCPVLPLPGREVGLDDVLRAPFAAKVGRYRRRAARTGHLRLESVEGEPVERALEVFADVVRLHTATWAGRGTPGVLSDGRVRRFHRAVIREAHPRGLVELYRLRLDDRVVAAYYGFRDARRAYYYLGGFDPAAGALSVGTLLLAGALEAALRRGAVEFDFLRGQEPYKYRWGARDRPTETLRLLR
jgi:CelD/BcsL family acetyltransferase involved in cellulose biosynthesis